MKDISKLKKGQKIRIILTDDTVIEGIVRFIEEDEEYDYEWVVHLDLENKDYDFLPNKVKLKILWS